MSPARAAGRRSIASSGRVTFVTALPCIIPNLRSPRDEHHFMRRVATVLEKHGSPASSGPGIRHRVRSGQCADCSVRVGLPPMTAVLLFLLLLQSAALTLNPASGRPGDVIRISGSGFGEGDVGLRFEIAGELQFLTTCPMTNGAFDCTFVVPAEAEPGPHVVAAVSEVAFETVVFTVEAPATLTPTPSTTPTPTATPTTTQMPTSTPTSQAATPSATASSVAIAIATATSTPTPP